MDRIPSTPAVQPGTDHPFRVPPSREQSKNPHHDGPQQPKRDSVELHDEEVAVEQDAPLEEGSTIDYRA